MAHKEMNSNLLFIKFAAFSKKKKVDIFFQVEQVVRKIAVIGVSHNNCSEKISKTPRKTWLEV